MGICGESIEVVCKLPKMYTNEKNKTSVKMANM